MKTFFNAALFILIFGTLLYMLPPVNEFLTAQVLTGNSQLLVSDFTFKPGDPGASTFDPSKVRKVITRVDTNTTLTRGTLGNGFELFQNLSAGEYSFEFSYDGGTLAQNNFKISTLSGFPNPPPPPGLPLNLLLYLSSKFKTPIPLFSIFRIVSSRFHLSSNQHLLRPPLKISPSRLLHLSLLRQESFSLEVLTLLG